MPDLIRVKLLSKSKSGADGKAWMQRFPGNHPVWGNCHFTFDRHCRDYDWLVVYDDLPSAKGERHTLWEEPLACPPEQTLLITTEPSTIKVYGNAFLRQFAWILTSQEPWATGNHPGAIYSQPGLVWFYADSLPRGAYDTIAKSAPLEKTGEISAVCSIKQQRHTLHRRRYQFVMDLKKRIPEMELFGRGIRFVEDKADALDRFKYHITIENFFGPHHWTEKLADAFLGACMPVYYGCPNAEDYFPAESLLRIDIADPEAAAEVIRRAIRDNLYEKHRAAILESRRRVLTDYAPIAQISRLVNERHNPQRSPSNNAPLIRSRHALRRKNVFNGISHGLDRIKVTLRHRWNRPGLL